MGQAVAYASMKLGITARIFVPSISSPAKVRRIRNYRAELVVTGDRYADALATSEVSAKQSGALSIHAFDQRETLLGQGTTGLEMEEECPDLDTLPCRGRTWRAYRRYRGLVWRQDQGGRSRARSLPNADNGAQGRRTSRRSGWWHSGGFSRTPSRRHPRLSHRQAACGPRSPGS
jgi:hypothetical protein